MIILQALTRSRVRLRVLLGMGASESVAGELLAYNQPSFRMEWLDSVDRFPLRDEPFVTEWDRYRQIADERDFLALTVHLIELCFPIERGMSKDPRYIEAIQSGVPPPRTETGQLHLADPSVCAIRLHQTSAGRIPMIITSSRADFVSLVSAFAGRNEPLSVPQSMGACCISGYRNRSRAGESSRFIILTTGWYSGVAPSAMDLSEADWRRLSFTLRREHESAHYFTRRVLGSMKSNATDELVADFRGICQAFGEFRARWLYLFWGLEDWPQYRRGRRLENYRGRPPLSDEAFALLQEVVLRAALNLETFHGRNAEALRGPGGTLWSVLAISQFALEELASDECADLLSSQLARWRDRFPMGELEGEFNQGEMFHEKSV